jgi:ATP-dependent Lon protease
VSEPAAPPELAGVVEADPLVLPVLPLKETVVFPEAVTPLAVGQERSIALIDDVVAGDRTLALVTVRNADADPPGFEDLHEIGTIAIVHKLIKVPDGTLRILVQGTERVRLVEPADNDPYLVARFEAMPDVVVDTPELEALTREVLVILNRELEVSELGSRIQSQVASEIDKGQREYFLRQQLKAIREELGEASDEAAEVEELRAQVEGKQLPDEVRTVVDRELARLERLPAAAAEHGVVRAYVDWILSLPWSETTEDDLDLRRARRILDEDHFDLDKVKERIVEQLAVSKLKHDLAGPILCFAGPPGVGKTSLGQSIARALGRKFQRISVGGVRDEAEIRGHRRTYIGAMPGTIVRALRDAGSRNPVLLIDEIDKMGTDFRGDPSSAMLEVLDPEQNSTFRDHYLDLPFDLSKVLFICTANQLETIPGPLLDRMDVIQLSGYTEEEKLGIARKYLVPKQLEAHGLTRGQVTLPPATLRLVISEYTREAGVRSLERQLATLCRKAATLVAKGKAKRIRVDERRVREWLGPRRVSAEARRRTADPGVATGLAYTAAGGDVLFVEASAYPGEGKLVITGQLGEVMRESAQAALSWVRAHADDLGVPPTWFADHDLHVHVPAGAVPKDGPSAGVTMATAIASLVQGRPVSAEVGMTGEVTLTGQVLPIGGLKEKVLAAERAGLQRVILPRENEPDLDELPPETRSGLEFVLAESMDDVLAAAFDGASSSRRRPHAAPEPQAARGR